MSTPTQPEDSARTVYELTEAERQRAVAAFTRAVGSAPEFGFAPDRAWLEGFCAALAAPQQAGGEAQQWIDDPHDIEQGRMLNPVWLKQRGLTVATYAAAPAAAAPEKLERGRESMLDTPVSYAAKLKRPASDDAKAAERMREALTAVQYDKSYASLKQRTREAISAALSASRKPHANGDQQVGG
jgi:hypothetical protein